MMKCPALTIYAVFSIKNFLCLRGYAAYPSKRHCLFVNRKCRKLTLLLETQSLTGLKPLLPTAETRIQRNKKSHGTLSTFT